MDGTKLEISGQPNNDSRAPAATYKPIPEADMEDEAVSRPKSLAKVKSGKEVDGADEKMLPQEENKTVPNVEIVLLDMKISPNEKQNGDAKIEVGEVKVFGGMDKEELMKYANDPFWVRLRWFLFITFWLLWASMLIGAVLIIYAAPKCDPPPPRTWWQEGPLTEIPADTDPENLKLIDKNVQGFIVSWTDDAYINFDDSHNVVKLIKQAKDLEKKVIVDLDPSSSDVWFEDSQNSQNDSVDFYIWRPAKSFENAVPVEPNNWLNVNSTPAWKYSEKRKEFYYSPIDKPLLNFRNENVTKKFSDVMTKFLEHGAAGIRIRNAPFLFVDLEFRDESIGTVKGYDHGQYGFYTHTKTQNLPELGPLLKQWRQIVRNKTEDGPFMVKEALSNMNVYRIDNSLVVDLPVESHTFTKQNILVEELVNNLNHTFNIENIEWPLWVVNSTALPKDVLNIVTYLLPGVPLVGQNDVVDTQLLKIRNTPSVMRGKFSIHSLNNDTGFGFVRETPGNPGVLVLVNTENERITVNIPQEIPALAKIPEVTVQLYSQNYNETDFRDVNAKKDASAIPLPPKSAIVLSYVPKKREE